MASPFAFIEHPSDAPALIDAPTGRTWTQDELAEAVRSSAEQLATGRRELVFVLCSGDVASTVAYLARSRPATRWRCSMPRRPTS